MHTGTLAQISRWRSRFYLYITLFKPSGSHFQCNNGIGLAATFNCWFILSLHFICADFYCLLCSTVLNLISSISYCNTDFSVPPLLQSLQGASNSLHLLKAVIGNISKCLMQQSVHTAATASQSCCFRLLIIRGHLIVISGHLEVVSRSRRFYMQFKRRNHSIIQSCDPIYRFIGNHFE